MIDFRELVKFGAHFGHIKRRLNPKMKPYIWGMKNNVHLIDVSKTAQLIERAAKFLESVSANKKTILWVGTKKAAQNSIFAAADKLKMPYVNHRWIGGTLSNFSQVKKSVTKLLHYEDILTKSDKFPHYTKKELNTFNKLVERLKKNIGGIRGLSWPIGAVVIVDALKERSALREAATVGIPVVALVDTNADPTLVDHVIPTNDDSARVVKLIIDYLSDSVVNGQKIAKTSTKKAKEDKVEVKPKVRAEGADKKFNKVKKPLVKPVAKKETKPASKPAPSVKSESASKVQKVDIADKAKKESKPKADTVKPKADTTVKPKVETVKPKADTVKKEEKAPQKVAKDKK